MSTWADLTALREAGHRPTIDLLILTRSHVNLRGALIEIGAMFIDYAPGDLINADLLSDLNVLLLLESCKQAVPFARAILNADAKPRRCRVWCPCSRMLSVILDQACPL
jgi:hypothetical protein